MPETIAALTRPLDPGGLLVIALHAGDEVRHVDEFLGHEVSLDYVLHNPAQLVQLLETAGLTDIEWYLRGPLASRRRQANVKAVQNSLAGLRQLHIVLGNGAHAGADYPYSDFIGIECF